MMNYLLESLSLSTGAQGCWNCYIFVEFIYSRLGLFFLPHFCVEKWNLGVCCAGYKIPSLKRWPVSCSSRAVQFGVLVNSLSLPWYWRVQLGKSILAVECSPPCGKEAKAWAGPTMLGLHRTKCVNSKVLPLWSVDAYTCAHSCSEFQILVF